MERQKHQEQVAKSDALRAILIRDAMLGSASHLGSPELFLLSFIDCLRLYSQNPLEFGIWRDELLVYSSLQDPDFRRHCHLSYPKEKSHRVRLEGHSGFELVCYEFDGSRAKPVAPNGEQGLLQPDRPSRTAMDDELRDLLLPILRKTQSMDDPHGRSSGTLDWHVADEVTDLPHRVCQDLLAPLRQVLSDAFEDVAHSPFLTFREAAGCDILPIYCAVSLVSERSHIASRRYNGSFPYTARLLLSDDQKDRLENWYEEQRTDSQADRASTTYASFESMVNAVEEPLGMRDRSIADLSFCSGTIAVGRAAGEQGFDVAADVQGKERQQAEALIYGQGMKGHVFHIPIHVSGVPWLTIYTFTRKQPGDDLQAWHHNFLLYRDVIPKAAMLLRSGAKEVYLKHLETSLVRHLSVRGLSEGEIVRRVNSDWLQLAQVYPFQLCRLAAGGAEAGQPSGAGSKASANEVALPLSERGSFRFMSGQNPFFRQQVGYHLLPGKELAVRLRKSMGEFLRSEAVTATQATAYAGHVVRTPIRAILGLARQIPGEAIGNRIRSFAQASLDLEQFANLFVNGDKLTRWQEERRIVANVDTFVAELQSSVDAALELRCSQRVASGEFGRWMAAADDVLSSGTSRLAVHIPDTASHVYYYKEYISAVIDALIENMLLHQGGHRDAQRGRVSMEVHIKESRPDALYFVLRSPTEKNRDSLRSCAESLSRRESDAVGITTIHLGSKVCRFAGPEWVAEWENTVGYLTAWVQIANVAQREEVPANVYCDA